MQPVVLPLNTFRHFYTGGAAIARFRGVPETRHDQPEDWIGSTTTRFGSDRTGLSVLPGGVLLRDAVARDQQAWLGPAHVEAYGADTGVLVKLLDVQERLIVHSHPDRAFAKEHLGCAHGKTEAWVILETAGSRPVVYVGFRSEVSAQQLRTWVDNQQTTELLAALNEIPIAAGDVVLVPAGVPHAIGAGVLIAEVQEPTDFSITLEWAGYDLDGRTEGHVGLGFDLALQSVDRSAWSIERVRSLFGPRDDATAVQELLPPPAAPFFRVSRLRDGADLPRSFAVAVVTGGSGVLRCSGGDVPVRRGSTCVVPYDAPTSVAGDMTVLVFMPPRPDAPYADKPTM